MLQYDFHFAKLCDLACKARQAQSAKFAPVAQLDRAFDCGSKGLRFESSRAHHLQRKTMNLDEILEKTKNVRLVAASKYVGASEIARLAKLGVSEFGENQVQALAQKKEALNGENLGIKWHFIGTLQSNKINLLIKQRPILWQSCNSLKLAQAVNQRLDYTLPALLEVNAADEASKSGLDKALAVDTYLQIQAKCDKIALCGVMSIGAHSDDERKIIRSFEQTFALYESLQKHGANVCSMGMSGDFELAIKCGANMVRLGSILFKNLA